MNRLFFISDRMHRLIPHAKRILIQVLRRKGGAELRPGFMCYGYPESRTGLGESFRGMIKAMNAAGLPNQVCDLDNMPEHPASFGINVVFVNGFDCLNAVRKIPFGLWLHRYNIAHWVWELEDIPETWYKYLPLFDEIWTPSSFSAAAIRKLTAEPVIVVPDIPDVQRERRYDRNYFGIPQEAFVFLTMYHSLSLQARKNPTAVIRAFREAFDETKEDVLLIVKATGCGDEEMQMLQRTAGGSERIRFITDDYSKDGVISLIDCADVYMSLHRSEGFGLVPAEAMKLGKPVIATNWSGNTDYMNKDNSCPVNYRLVPVADPSGFFRNGRWAEADIFQAAAYMRQLYTDPLYYQRISCAARAFAERTLTYDSAGEIMAERYRIIYDTKSTDER